MFNAVFNLALLALSVGMAIYHGRLYILYRQTFRLAFLVFWFLLGVEMVSGEEWLMIPAAICLVYGIWRRRRIGRNLERLLAGDESAGEASL